MRRSNKTTGTITAVILREPPEPSAVLVSPVSVNNKKMTALLLTFSFLTIAVTAHFSFCFNHV